MLMLPEPRESAPVDESGFEVAGELVLGDAVSIFGVGLGGVGSGVLVAVCFGSVFGFGVVAWTGARPGRNVTMRLVPCWFPGSRIGAMKEAR